MNFAIECERMSKMQLHALADDLLSGATDAVERSVRFICAETKGLWHGRGRAMMCRRLKHLDLPRSHREHLVSVILDRLGTGRFSEQFRDQLRLAMHLDRDKTLAAARRARMSEKEYVRRTARWVLSHREPANDGPASPARRSIGQTAGLSIEVDET